MPKVSQWHGGWVSWLYTLQRVYCCITLMRPCCISPPCKGFATPWPRSTWSARRCQSFSRRAGFGGWSAVPFCRFLGKKPSLADCYCAKPRERPWIARSCLNMPRSLMHFKCIFLKTVRNRQRNRLVVFLGFACDHTGRSSWRASNYWASLRWTRYNPLDMYRQQGSPNCENLPQSSLFAHSCLSLSCTLAPWSLVMLRCT